MKELSIEEKAKAYDEAIERAKNTIEVNQTIPDIVECVESLFPELKESKESEDERVKKAIKYGLDYVFTNNTTVYETTKEQCLAWLEKQGNLMKALQISNAKIGELIEKNYYLKEQLEKQGKNNMGISEATKQELEDNLNKALEKETPESCNEFLEKKGEQNTTIEMITPEESLGIDSDTYNKIVDECVYGEQKPADKVNSNLLTVERAKEISPFMMSGFENESADKVEQKFKVGDWLQYRNAKPFFVEEITKQGYVNCISCLPFDWENEIHLWTIQDAKDGDVLVSESTCGLGTWYCIFKSLDGDESMTVYCYLTRDGRFETKKELCFDKDPYNTKPATKEQIDTLMKVMADAGYEWDAEKKELKNIEEEYNGEDYGIDGLYAAIDILQKTLGEVDGYQSDDGILTHKCAISAVKELSKQKPAWGEEDIELLDNTIKFIEYSVAATPPSLRTYNPTLTGKEIPFLKALKDRVQPKQEWSEEDEKILNLIIARLHSHPNVEVEEYGKDYHWLKSLKQRYTWKPSDEQMDALRYVTNFDYGGYKATLVSLYEQLKKLIGE